MPRVSEAGRVVFMQTMKTHTATSHLGRQHQA